jgi:hypothetical protein
MCAEYSRRKQASKITTFIRYSHNSSETYNGLGPSLVSQVKEANGAVSRGCDEHVVVVWMEICFHKIGHPAEQTTRPDVAFANVVKSHFTC